MDGKEGWWVGPEETPYHTYTTTHIHIHPFTSNSCSFASTAATLALAAASEASAAALASRAAVSVSIRGFTCNVGVVGGWVVRMVCSADSHRHAHNTI